MITWLRAGLEQFAGAEISSRSLAVIRISAMLVIIPELSGVLTTHRVDAHPPAVALAWLVLLAMPFALVGYKTRWALGLMALGFGVLHYYYGFILYDTALGKPVQSYQVIVLLWLTPSGRSLSVDRYLAVTRAVAAGDEPPPERVAWWQLELFLLQICTIYFWAALDKSDSQWLAGERMERYWIYWYGNSDMFSYAGGWLHGLAVVAAWATTILEYALAVGLLSRRLRPWIVIGGFALHLGIMFGLSVPFFTTMMFVLLFAAIPPQAVHDAIDDLA